MELDHILKNTNDIDLLKEKILSTIAYFHYDLFKASGALGLSETDIHNIIANKKIPLRKEIDHVLNNFVMNVSNCDPVTNLESRLPFLTRMTKLVIHKIPFLLIFIDLNKFKCINDTYGHLVGDQVLEQIAQRLKNHSTHAEGLTRLGGDEFCIILLNYKQTDMRTYLTSIKSVIGKPININHVADTIQVECAAAYAAYPEDGKSVKEILELADKWMYEDKKRADQPFMI